MCLDFREVYAVYIPAMYSYSILGLSIAYFKLFIYILFTFFSSRFPLLLLCVIGYAQRGT